MFTNLGSPTQPYKSRAFGDYLLVYGTYTKRALMKTEHAATYTHNRLLPLPRFPTNSLISRPPVTDLSLIGVSGGAIGRRSRVTGLVTRHSTPGTLREGPQSPTIAQARSRLGARSTWPGNPPLLGNDTEWVLWGREGCGVVFRRSVDASLVPERLETAFRARKPI